MSEKPNMGRKKRERPAKTVRLDADLITKAKTLADDQGTDVANYLSGLIRPVIEREWVRFQKRIMESDAGS